MSSIMSAKGTKSPAKRLAILLFAAIFACNLSFPQLAFAAVRVDQTELNQGQNTVGGGTATLTNSTLDMSGVTANELFTDEDLSVNFNGGNNIGNVNVAGSANVDLNFPCENEVSEVHAADSSNVTINANGNNEFEEVEASGQSNLTINVTGENDIEEIEGRDNANITVRGTDCQKKDTINLGEDEATTSISTEKGKLTIDHVTIKLKGMYALVGSQSGDVVIDTSKIAKDDGNLYTQIEAGGTMQIRESVVDIVGAVHSSGKMTIDHSDMKVGDPDNADDAVDPYRISSDTDIELINEKNGEVKEGKADGKKVKYVDTDDNDGKDVDLKADGEPEYYHCKGEATIKAMPKTGDDTNPFLPMAAGIASAMTAAYAARRSRNTAD